MRILVIEDEKKVANFIKKGLEEEHYAVDNAYDGESGCTTSGGGVAEPRGHGPAGTTSFDEIFYE